MSSAERAATASVSSRGPLDEESREWLRCLAGPGEREQAFARLHKLLLRAARAELRRRSFAVRVEGREWDDLARNAIYKTMFDARRKIREHLVTNGYLGDGEPRTS